MAFPSAEDVAKEDKGQIIFIAVGGATCSGKTTLAKHLARILPNSPLLLHQDDFAPPSELVPIHPVYQVQDWDDAKGAVLWDKQRSAIKYLRQHGKFPSEHYSHDHLNEQIAIPISEDLQYEWKDKFEELSRCLAREKTGEIEEGQNSTPLYIIADGFLILYDDESVREFDVRLFVREDYSVLKKRREVRHGYHTAGQYDSLKCIEFIAFLSSDFHLPQSQLLTLVQSDPEGALWRDPPNYFDEIVWPAYVSAHEPLFKDGNVESGTVDQNKIEGLVVLDGSTATMDETVRLACETIYDTVKHRRTAKSWSHP